MHNQRFFTTNKEVKELFVAGLLFRSLGHKMQVLVRILSLHPCFCKIGMNHIQRNVLLRKWCSVGWKFSLL